MADKLKPCPFCGCKPEKYGYWSAGHPSGDNGYQYTIECPNISCKVRITRWAMRKSWAIKSAVEAWNRRSEQK